MAQKAEKMLLKILNEWLCNVQLFPKVWILEIFIKAFWISGTCWKNVFFALTDKTLLVFYFTDIHPDSNRSRIPWIWLVPEPEWIRIQNLKNRIGSGLKKIRVRTPLPLTVQSLDRPLKVLEQGYHIGVFHASFFKAFGIKILVWHFGFFLAFFFQSGNSVTHLHLEMER